MDRRSYWTGDSFVGDLNAADRRIVHHVAGEYPNVKTFSEGEGRERRIIIATELLVVFQNLIIDVELSVEPCASMNTF